MKTLDILYEDNFALIINKPAGLAVQGGKNVKKSLDSILKEIYTVTPLLVHRLDKDTSGVILVAKNKEAAAKFSFFFNNNESKNNPSVQKTYIAVCAKVPDKNEGIITGDIEIRGKTKKALTKYKVIKTATLKQDNKPDLIYSVLEIELGTGRMHQIRRHLAGINCPILGDDKYGDFKLNKTYKLKKLLLHARRLIIKEANIDVIAPEPEYFLTYT